MAGDTMITIVGNLVDDPELRFTPTGQAVARFRIASTPRYMDRQTGEWKDGEALFLTCNIWRQAAENVAESLTRGMRVIVYGRLRQRSYETKEGERRGEKGQEPAGGAPRRGTAPGRVKRTPGEAGFGGGGRGDARWATATPAPPGSYGPQGGGGGGFGGDLSDEPPF
nr:MAG: single-stranded DNA-binding protein [Actinomycetota bacterium]